MTHAATRLASALADRYRLERELGQGGMATVYLAQDLKHDRQVAIKVLRPELAAVIGAERFVSEIKTTANLQHPHILPLHDSGEADSFLFYVMPFIEGETLRDRLTRERQLPVTEAVRITKEVASALEYAHKRGVIHRDIKPENILLHDGAALVADFGIALAASKAGGDRMTQTGMSLGTPSYMSPEQAMGDRDIGPRSDVYALGAMAYEMLAGEPPFTGSSAQAIVAKVLTEEPASIKLRRKTVPPAVEDAVLTALQKLPADRWGSAKEFSDALDGTGMPRTRVLRATRLDSAGGHARSLTVPLLLLLGATAAIAAWGWLRRPAAAPRPLARFEVRLPYLQQLRSGYSGGTIALSPDGGTIAYVARRTAGRSTLMLRDRDALEPRALEGTDGADAPFFSPDGAWVGYTAGGRMYKVPTHGGAPMLLTDSANTNVPEAHWNIDHTITFTGPSWDIRTMPEDGGPARILVRPPTSVVGYAFPTPLPRADAMLATACSANCAGMTLMALDLGSGESHEIAKGVSRAWYLPPGRLVFARQDGSVFVQPFDLKTLELRGAPVPLVPRVGISLGIAPELAVSADGTLLHVELGASRQLRLTRAGRDGTQTPVDPGWMGDLSFHALSPDGRQLAVTVANGAQTEVWVKQLDRGPFTRLAYEGNVNYRPAWQPDGRTLGFISDRSGRNLPYQARADGSGTATGLAIPDTLEIDELDWSRDGKWLAYRTGARAGLRRVAIMPLPSGKAQAVESGAFDQYMPTISPDSRWLAYVSVESGREDVYVRPVADPGAARWQVSTAGGTSPVWSHSGRELFFVDGTDQLIAVPIGAGPGFQSGEPKPLFRLVNPALSPFHQSLAVTPDDRSFLFLQDASAGDAASHTATLTLNALTNVP